MTLTPDSTPHTVLAQDQIVVHFSTTVHGPDPTLPSQNCRCDLNDTVPLQNWLCCALWEVCESLVLARLLLLRWLLRRVHCCSPCGQWTPGSS